MRLHKFLAHAGVASRRKAESLIATGKIKVNSEIVDTQGMMVDPEKDIVEYNGKRLTITVEKTYLAIHKPVGYVSSVSSNQGKSVLDLVKSKERLYPVGRLDKDSSGLMILTNDGELANKLTHPRYETEKEYFVVLDRDLLPKDIVRLERGVTLGGKRLKDIRVVMAKNKSARLILKEGVNRQIRKMLGGMNYTVLKLKRVRIGKLELGELQPGQSKHIDKKDVTA